MLERSRILAPAPCTLSPAPCLSPARSSLPPAPCPLQVRTSRTFIRDCTVASPLAILLFGGSLAVAHDSSYVQVDGWLRIRCMLALACTA